MKRYFAIAVCVSTLGCARSAPPPQARSPYRVEAPESVADPRNLATRPALVEDALGAVALASTNSLAGALGYKLKGFKFVPVVGAGPGKVAADGTASALREQLCSTPRAARVAPAHVLAPTAEGAPTLVLDSADLPGVGAVRLEMGQREDGKVDVAVLASGALLCQGDAWSLTADGVPFAGLPEAPKQLDASVSVQADAPQVARSANVPWMVGHPWRLRAAPVFPVSPASLQGVVLRQELSPALVRELLTSHVLVLTMGGASVQFAPRKSSVVQEFAAQLR